MDIITRINWVDILVITIIIRISYVSYSEGLSHAVLPLVGAVCVATVSLGYYERLSIMTAEHAFGIPIEVVRPAVFLVLAVATGLMFKLAKVIVDKIVKVSWFPAIEKIGGCIVGIMRASILTSLILVYLAMIPLDYFKKSMMDRSVTGIYFLGIAPAICEKTSKFLPNFKSERGD